MYFLGMLGISQYVEKLWTPTPPNVVLDWGGGAAWVLAALAALLALWARRAGPLAPLPGPISLPLVGTKWIYLLRYRLNKLHEAYDDLFARHGDILVEWCDGTPVVSVCERDALERVLRAPARRPRRPPTELVQLYRRARPDRYASTGIVNEQGDSWHFLRRHLTGQLTSPRTIAGFLPDLNTICDDFLRLLVAKRGPDGRIHAFEQLTNRMGLETSCALMLGARMTFLEDQVSPRATMLADAVKQHFTAQRDSYFGWPLWKYLPTPLYRKFCISEEIIHSLVSEIVDAAVTRSKDSYNDGLQEIFLSILENKELDVRDKKAAIIDFITAGIETLANSLVFLLYLLAKNPECQEKIHTELSTVAPNASEITVEQLGRTEYTKACIQEAFRLLPTAPFLARILEHPMNLCGYDLEAGTVVLCHTMLACRREESFESPLSFKPERWCGGSRESGMAAVLVAPFGVGKRMCPGKRFVEHELQLILIKLMQRFRVEYEGELDTQFDFLLAPKPGVTFRLLDR